VGALFENEPEIQDYGHSLIEMIKGSNRLKGAINVSGKHVLELKAMSDKASNLRWVASTETIHLKKRVKCAFQKILMALLNKVLC
jgi:hypothetical protein